MSRDPERIRRIQETLRAAGLDAVVCGLPSHVLLLSGYWPVVGTAMAMVTADGGVAAVVPEDERELAQSGWADDLRVFQPGSLDEMTDASEAILEPLREAAEALRVERGRVGHDGGETFQPATYASMHLYGAATRDVLSRSLPAAELVSANDLLTTLMSIKTPGELAQMRAACRVAEEAFRVGAAQLEPGQTEGEAAARFREPLSAWREGVPSAQRMDGFTYCMSGANAAQAYGAYQRSRPRRLAAGDLVLVHCNSYVDGHWTDVTRTYCLGEPDGRQHRMYEAVFAARQAALEAIRPGARGDEVDRAAREVLAARGFGNEFKHPTGHGVGFAAIDHNARPRLHPKSQDVLEIGAACNVEPGIYISGYGGMRHCDMVAVGAAGPEVLTAFHGSIEDAAVSALASSA